MRRLFRAETHRLLKSKWFRVVLGIVAAIGMLMQAMMYFENQSSHIELTFDAGLFLIFLGMGFIAAVVVSFLVGTEYSDGTIRNKIMVGHGRGKMYLVNLVMCELGGLLTMAAFWLGYTIVGFPLFGFTFMWTASEILIRLGLSILTLLAYTAIFVMIANIVQNKTMVAVITLLIAFFLWFGGVILSSRLSEPERYDDYVMTEAGNVEVKKDVINPYYIRGTKRMVYTTLAKVLPGSQTLALSGGNSGTEVNGWLGVYSCMVAVGCSGIGYIVFKKKDIK